MIHYALTLVYLLFALAKEPFAHAENAVSAIPGEATTSSLSISNVVPRQDDRGQLMDQHDGNLLKVGDLWYWYGMGYTDCKLETGAKRREGAEGGGKWCCVRRALTSNP